MRESGGKGARARGSNGSRGEGRRVDLVHHSLTRMSTEGDSTTTRKNSTPSTILATPSTRSAPSPSPSTTRLPPRPLLDLSNPTPVYSGLDSAEESTTTTTTTTNTSSAPLAPPSHLQQANLAQQSTHSSKYSSLAHPAGHQEEPRGALEVPTKSAAVGQLAGRVLLISTSCASRP